MPWTAPKASASSRGYGKAHRQLRKQWEPIVAAGGVGCWRCGRVINPGTPWHLGHSDWGNVTKGPECVKCNLSAAARKGRLVQTLRKRDRPTVVDRW